MTATEPATQSKSGAGDPVQRLHSIVDVLQRHIDSCERVGLDTLAANLTGLQFELATIAGDMSRARKAESFPGRTVITGETQRT